MRRARQITIAAAATAILIGILFLLYLWQPGGVPVWGVLAFSGGIAWICFLIWKLATGRDGLIHRGPTARRLRRPNGGAVPAAGQRPANGLAPRPYGPGMASREPDDDPDKRLERELLVAVKKYGPGSDEVRAIAAEIVRRPPPP
jgi:hypothetical protein